MSLDELWAGEFGETYTERNLNAGADRGPFWDTMMRSLHFCGDVLEVGCNVGANLRYLPTGSYGVDVNARALAEAKTRLPETHLSQASVATRLPFPDAMFGLVITCGVLIHIAPSDIGRAIREVFRVSARYVLVMEYAAAVETMVEYRNQQSALWKRNWPGEVIGALYGARDWRHTWSCPLGKEHGFDDVTAYLWERK